MKNYNRKLKHKARVLRGNQTDAEQKLWSHVRRKQLLDVQFYRQKPIGEFIVDFYAPAAKLVIELDGSQHLEPVQQAYDQQRSAFLQQQGLRVLRFSNLDVLQQIESVMTAIFEALQIGLKIPPIPPFSKGGVKQPPLDETTQPSKPITYGLFEGKIQVSDDFDEPLPDSFWLAGVY